MSSPPKERVVSVSISELSKSGMGFGYADIPQTGMAAVEVPFTMPGDKAEALLLRKNKGVYQSRLKTLIEPSPERIPPRCLHFSACGGCQWQHIPYEKQLQLKQEFVRRCFSGLVNETVALFPVVPCQPPWQYRNKMEFSFSSDKYKNRYLGLILQGTRGHVFNIQECHLIQPWVIDTAQAVRKWWEESKLEAYNPHKNTGSLRTLTLREGCRTGDRLVMITVSGNPDFAWNRQQLDSFKQAVRAACEPADSSKHLSLFLRIQQVCKGSPTNFYEMHLYGPDHIREQLWITSPEALSLNFKVSPAAFFQPNTMQAERLYSRALELVQISKESLVYDLYCGTGTLGICAAHQAAEVIGIELAPESVLDARENIKLNHLTNVNILAGDVGKVLAKLSVEDSRRPDLVMVDPPRAGLDPKAIQHLLAIKAPQLLYISCNPVSQAANIKELVAGGYKLEALQPVDQFPQTTHIENIAVLKVL